MQHVRGAAPTLRNTFVLLDPAVQASKYTTGKDFFEIRGPANLIGGGMGEFLYNHKTHVLQVNVQCSNCLNLLIFTTSKIGNAAPITFCSCQ